jgi:hypothetical protein
MSVVPRPFPSALPHGELREVLPGIHFVSGTVKLPGPLPLRFSRAMTVVKEGERLVLVNSVRLDEAGLVALDRLGRVTDVIRLAGNHGMDDPFYADRYGAKVWAVSGQRYTAGFDTRAETTYFRAQVEMDASTSLPIEGARLHLIASQPPEALLLIPRHDGVVIAGDCLQNWSGPDRFFSWPARLLMPLMGFFRPYNIGPAWFKQCKPPAADLRAILDLPFERVLPSHGEPVLDDARARYRPAIDRVTAA